MIESLVWKKITEEQRKVILNSHSCYPIAVGKLAKNFGIVVKKATLKGNLAGEIKEEAGIVTVRVNSHDVKARQRYTIAHEIAHFLLHRQFLKGGIQDTPLYRSHLSNEIEREADALAADILMPIQIVQDLMDKNSKEHKGERLYEVVAESLEVSKIALKIRLGVE